jgi:hypothetical protein
LVERLFALVERVAKINDVTTLTTEVILAAQKSLIIGAFVSPTTTTHNPEEPRRTILQLTARQADRYLIGNNRGGPTSG